MDKPNPNGAQQGMPQAVHVALRTKKNGVPGGWFSRVPCVGEMMVARIGEEKERVWLVTKVLHTPMTSGTVADVHLASVKDPLDDEDEGEVTLDKDAYPY